MDLNQKPGKISPLIKGARWSFLLFGIMFGITKKLKYESMEKRESILRAKRIETFKIEDYKAARVQYQNLIKDMAEILDVTIPPGWEPPY